MTDLKDQTKNKINEAATAAKKATDKVIDKAKDVAHASGEKLDETAKKLKKA